MPSDTPSVWLSWCLYFFPASFFSPDMFLRIFSSLADLLLEAGAGAKVKDHIPRFGILLSRFFPLNSVEKLDLNRFHYSELHATYRFSPPVSYALFFISRSIPCWKGYFFRCPVPPFYFTYPAHRCGNSRFQSFFFDLFARFFFFED